jgi:GDP-4-dehydro-6-deoxy-D-mannose reductase
VGSHLVDLLLQDPDVRIEGILHPSHQVQHLEENPRIRVNYVDILRAEELENTIREIQPEVVYHLAGMAHVHESWVYRKETIDTNFIGSFHLLEACRKLDAFPKLLLVGSAECYGIVPEHEQPITEQRSMLPSSPYAVSKIAQEMLGIQYARAEKLPVYLSRSFNHTGPRQKETFVCPAFARQIALAEIRRDNFEICVGNLVARRDFSDVRDVARAYKTILESGIPGEPYNVCSGRALSIENMLHTLLSYSTDQFEVTTDPAKFRPADMPLVLGSFDKLQKTTGWRPEFTIEDTLRDLLNYWREKLRAEPAA